MKSRELLALLVFAAFGGATWGQAPPSTPPVAATLGPPESIHAGGPTLPQTAPLHPSDHAGAPTFPQTGPQHPSDGSGPCCQGGCADSASGSANGRYWGEAEALFWWLKGAAVPPLVTTSPPGALVPGSVLLGDHQVNLGGRLGFRLGGGAWINDDHTLGAEASFFILDTQATRFTVSSGGNPILARPFIDSTTGGLAAEPIAVPDALSGTFNASESAGTLLGFGALLRERICCGCTGFPVRVDVLAGYRYLYFSDRLDIRENLTVGVGGFADPNTGIIVPAGAQLGIRDRFTTSNDFHGADLGLNFSYSQDGLTLAVRTKLAIGYTFEAVDIRGSTTSTLGTATATAPGGLFALPSNIGHFKRAKACIIPDLNIKLGYQITPAWRVTMAYNLLYWQDMVRAGDQVDLLINSTQLPGPIGTATPANRPNFEFRRIDFWAQGISLGLEYQF
jgi:hypothetical protein